MVFVFYLKEKHYDNSKNNKKKVGRNDIFDETTTLESTVAAGVVVKDKYVLGDAAPMPAPQSLVVRKPNKSEKKLVDCGTRGGEKKIKK